jgi:NAD(P)-dependent dehydrogenase (short-subunit alcohol dehydrogenase family)
MSWNVAGKTVVLTGASRGIGRTAALALGKQGAKLSLVVRNRELGESVVRELASAGAPTARLFVADLSLVREVRRVGAELLAAHDAIDVLVNNAGAVFMDREVTAEGLERTFATNHMAYFVLTGLLREALVKAPSARVVSVSSAAHRFALDWDDVMAERSYSGFVVYGRSKLMNILFTRALSKRLEGTSVTANCLHPGVIGSNFGHNGKGLFAMLAKLGRPLLSSEEKGARTTVHLASSPEVQGVTGKYFVSSKEAKPWAHALRDDDAERLWTLSEELSARLA